MTQTATAPLPQHGHLVVLRQRRRKRTTLIGVVVGLAGFMLICMCCGIIGLVTDTPDTQVARVDTSPDGSLTIREATAIPEPLVVVETGTIAESPVALESPTPPEPERTPEPAASPEAPTATGLSEPTVAREPTVQTSTNQQTAQVIDVVDGDTLTVMLAGQQQTVRLLGIDTPETVHPQRPVECFGREASAKVRELAANQQVQLQADPTQDSVDRYGRLLRYVYLPDGRLLNLELINQGYAFEYTYNVPYVYQAEFQQAQRDASANQRGLWAPDTCDGEQKPADEPLSEPPSPPVIEEPPAQPADNCHPAYAGVCIPPPPPDLNCPEIRAQYGCSISVVSHPDPHEIDRDQDGIGCECQ